MIRDNSHLEDIRSMFCTVCDVTPCHAAHIRIGGGGGIGMKPPDNMVVPLCEEHHREQHRIGERRFWSMHLGQNGDAAMRVMRGYANSLYLQKERDDK